MHEDRLMALTSPKVPVCSALKENDQVCEKREQSAHRRAVPQSSSMSPNESKCVDAEGKSLKKLNQTKGWASECSSRCIDEDVGAPNLIHRLAQHNFKLEPVKLGEPKSNLATRRLDIAKPKVASGNRPPRTKGKKIVTNVEAVASKGKLPNLPHLVGRRIKEGARKPGESMHLLVGIPFQLFHVATPSGLDTDIAFEIVSDTDAQISNTTSATDAQVQTAAPGTKAQKDGETA
uniref:Uncharacterized protein n=1 Tax=Solanum tuberosum TaxID=4113 RepID=M1D994_SOLTU